MNARLQSLLAAALFAATPLAAQQPAATPDSGRSIPDTTAVTAPVNAAASTSAAVPVAVTRQQTRAAQAPSFQSRAGVGQSKAMMIVGFGGLVAGAIIGGDVGTIIMVGGAIIGLYGLYKYLQ
jgi:hypothetical protein